MMKKPISLKKVPHLAEFRARLPGVKAHFFDMDGTIFNTEAIHAEALISLALKYRIRSPLTSVEMHAIMLGKADHLVFDIIKDWEGIPSHWTTATPFIDEKNDAILELLKKHPPEGWFASEVSTFLKEGKMHLDHIALITSSERKITEELLRLVGLNDFFNFVLTRDDSLKLKPDPWPYLKALELSGLSQDEVIIFEDSDVGLEAALQSGCHVAKVEWY
jgi:HAD superfamily hydrolase (TIGR01509 family)